MGQFNVLGGNGRNGKVIIRKDKNFVIFLSKASDLLRSTTTMYMGDSIYGLVSLLQIRWLFDEINSNSYIIFLSLLIISPSDVY